MPPLAPSSTFLAFLPSHSLSLLISLTAFYCLLLLPSGGLFSLIFFTFLESEPVTLLLPRLGLVL